jgi:hypothetical protein
MHGPDLWINGKRMLVVWTNWALPSFRMPEMRQTIPALFP